jgi:uncharacterized membrane protein YfcA
MSDPVEEIPEILAQRYLPDALKSTCIVVPKRLFTWAAANIMILGAGMGMLLGSLLAEWMDSDLLSYGFPISLIVAWLIARTILDKEEKRFLSNLPQDES